MVAAVYGFNVVDEAFCDELSVGYVIHTSVETSTFSCYSDLHSSNEIISHCIIRPFQLPCT